MNTDWDQRRAMEEKLATDSGLTITEARDLIEDADTAEVTLSLLEGLQEALLQQLGMKVVDMSTDDEYKFVIVEAEDDDGQNESVLI